MPYILGGDCVRTPGEETLRSYQDAGYLLDLSLNDLEDLYKLEGILIEGRAYEPGPGLHILEGGSWLYTPKAGTAGFMRLYAQPQPPYQPRSPEVRDLAQRVRSDQVARTY